MAINTQKFLPAPKSSVLAKITPKGGELAKITPKTVSTQGFSSTFSGKTIKNIGIIKVKVIQIEKILKGTIALEKKSLDDKKRKDSGTRREKQEEKLETKPNVEKGNIKMPSAPRLGILDWVKNFIGNIILGYFAVRLIDHLPKIMPILKFLGAAADFIIDIGGKLLNGLVTFIDIGYKAYDATRGLVKNLFGKKGENQFDQLSSTLNTFLNTVIIAGMLFAGSGGFGGGPKGGGSKGGGSSAPGTRGTRTISGGGPQGRPDVRNPLRQTPKVTTSGGGGAGKPDIRNPLRQKPKVTTGGGGDKLKLPKGLKPKGGLLGLVFLIPDLIESGMLVSQGRGKDGIRTLISAVSGVAAGMAAYAAVLAGVAALGISVVGIPAAIALAVAGFAASYLAGEAAYKLTEVGLRKMGLVDNDPKTGKPYTYKGGGITRGGKTQGKIKRTIKKSKKTIRTLPSKVKPGQSIGGEKNIKKIFPEIKSEDKGKKINPYGYMKSSYEKLSSAEAFGGLFALPLKAQLGEEPSKLDYQNAASGLNSWMQKTFSSEIMRTGGVGFAEGGSVNAGMFSNGEDLTKIISKSLEESISSKVTDSINDLKKQLGLKPDEGEVKDKKSDGTTSSYGSEVGAAGGSGDKLTMARNLMRDLGLTADQAAGIVGNMDAESGVENARVQDTPSGTKGVLKVDDRTGYGLVQWTSRGRQQALADYAKSKGADLSKPLSMNIEYQFFLKEFKGSYGGVLEQIKKAKDVKTASTIFMQQYEVPEGYKTEAKIMERYNKSKPIYDKLAKGEGKATEGPGTYIGSSSSSAGGTLGAGTGGTYGRSMQGTKISGDLGKYMYKSLRSGDDFSQVSEHPNFGGSFRRSYQSWHNVDRAVDIGGYWPKDQVKILAKVEEFSKKNNVKPVELLYGKPGTPESGSHGDHVHVAYAKGGETKPYAHTATLGEKGKETVIDADSTKGLASLAPNLLEKLNAAKTKPQLMKILQSYVGGETQIAATYGGASAEKQQKIDAFMNQKGMPAGKGFQGRFDMFGREYDTNTGKLKQASNKPSQDTQIAATYGEGFPKKNFMNFLEKDYQKNLKNPIKNNTNDDSRPSRANSLPLAQKSLSSPQIASYASYEQSYPSEVFIPIPIPVPTGGGNSSGSSGGTIIAMGGGSNPFDSLYKGG